ncbi:hypothetical protein OEZ86_014003 [Tetradesmus obliquus]|nr:hypothetical protein OEZ86_014003 [Tetradesmus obliquus]
MGKIVIPRPPNAVVAQESACSDVLPFTYNISAFRGRNFEERGLLLHYTPPQEAGAAPKQRPPSDSYLSITYPFTSNELLRDQYQRFSSPFLRVGLLLEDMDSFAADVATRHLGGLPPGYTVVTATVDKVAFATAPAERSAANRARRASKRLLTGTEPAGDEVSLLYELAEEQLQRQIAQREEHEALSWAASASTAGRPPQLPGQPAALGPVPMSCSSQSHLAIMHRQDRNNAGSIFGGHLLRLAAELAYSTAVLHAGRHCEAVAMGDVAFKQPVPIGCVLEMRAKVRPGWRTTHDGRVLEMRAKVVYTAGALMRVTVVATKHQQLMEQRSASELQSSVTNDFTFVLAAVGSAPLRPVEPESLREALQYLAAHRQHTSDGYSAPALLLRDGMEHVLLAGEGAAAH